jgi:hypothetical protein
MQVSSVDLSELPLQIICSFLSPNELLTARRISKSWRIAAEQDELWQSHVQGKDFEECSWFQRYKIARYIAERPLAIFLQKSYKKYPLEKQESMSDEERPSSVVVGYLDRDYDKKKELGVWDLANGQLVARFSDCHAWDYCHDKVFLLRDGESKRVVIVFDVKTREAIDLEAKVEGEKFLKYHQGKIFLLGTFFLSVEAFDAETGARLFSFSNDGRYSKEYYQFSNQWLGCLLQNNQRGAIIAIHDLEKGEEKKVIIDEKISAFCIADGCIYALANQKESKLYVFDISESDPVKLHEISLNLEASEDAELNQIGKIVSSKIVISGERCFVVRQSDGQAFIEAFETQHGTYLYSFRHPEKVLDFTAIGDVLLATEGTGINIWEADTGNWQKKVIVEEEANFNCVRLFGKRIVISNGVDRGWILDYMLPAEAIGQKI